MKVEAVTVCINFSKYLKQCLSNKDLLDRWIIITHELDEDTIALCKENDLEYVLSKRIYEKGAPFAKGKAINEGLELLDKDDWLLQLDGDIILPSNFRNLVAGKGLDGEGKGFRDTNRLYGARRYLKSDPSKELKYMCNSNSGMERLCIGFFQLWHSSILKEYPQISNNARFDDHVMMLFYRDELHNTPTVMENMKLIDVSEVVKEFHEGIKEK